MLAAVSPVSLCAGIRLEAAGPSAVAGFADFRALFRSLTDASSSVSARVEVVGGDAVCRSSKCYRVLAAGAGSGSGSFEAEKSGDAARVRRCEACTHYLNSVLLPRVREEAADVAATGGGSGRGSGSDSDSGVSEKRRVVVAREAEAGTKRRIGGSRGNSTAYEETTHQQPKAGWVDEGRREGSPQAVTGTKRQEASAEGSRPATKGVSVGQKVGHVFMFVVGTQVAAFRGIIRWRLSYRVVFGFLRVCDQASENSCALHVSAVICDRGRALVSGYPGNF